MSPYRIHHKRDDLRNELFDVTLHDKGAPTYTPKPGADGAIIAATWADHGICALCHERTLSVGRCPDCGAYQPVIPVYFPNPSLAQERGPIAKTAARLIARFLAARKAWNDDAPARYLRDVRDAANAEKA